jgi:DNA-binding LacI/PurR family transcriptional regulator
VENNEKGLQAKALYTQILAEMRTRILSGELAIGDRLPSELQIAQQYQTSRGIVRHALNILVDEGLLERIQGSGTFVCQSALTHTRNVAPAMQKSIGVILSEANDELNMGILRGVEQAARTRGYHLNFAYVEENTQEFAQSIVRLRTNASGLVIFPISNESHNEAVAQLQRDNFPLVLVDRYISDLDCDYVTSDNLGGGYRATEHLLILGHTRIGFVYSTGGELLTTTVRDRWEGYRKALHEYNRPYDETLIYKVSTQKQGPSIMSYGELVARPERPSAFFAANDAIALTILRAAQHRGLNVPGDIALVGFDDLSFAAHLDVPLTTVAQQHTEMGLHAGTLLINRIEHQLSDATRHIELSTNLIIRQSCGARLRITREPSVGIQP